MGKIADFVKGVALPQQKARQAVTLDAEFENAVSQNQVLQSENLKLRAEVNPLKRTIEEQKQIIAQLKSSSERALTFNPATGTHIEQSTGIHYCTNCLSSNKRSPLKNEPHGWCCMVCDQFFQDPARPWPTIPSYRPLDPVLGM
jgi:hypothetical protein